MGRASDHISQSVATKIIRALKLMGYGAVSVNTSGRENNWDAEKIWVTRNQEDLCDINCSGNTITYRSNSAQSVVEDILNMIQDYCEQEENYINGLPVQSDLGPSKYRIIAEYNDAILTASEVSSRDSDMQEIKNFEYVTWEKGRKEQGYELNAGHFFSNDYTAAKEDFAVRSGMIRRDKLFSETEMKAILAGLVKLAALDENTDDNSEIYYRIKQKIEGVIPDMGEKVYSTNPCYEENRKYATKYEVDPEDSFVLERESL